MKDLRGRNTIRKVFQEFRDKARETKLDSGTPLDVSGQVTWHPSIQNKTQRYFAAAHQAGERRPRIPKKFIVPAAPPSCPSRWEISTTPAHRSADAVAAKKDGTPSKLQKSGALSRGVPPGGRNNFAKVSNPMIYAVPIHASFDPKATELGKKSPARLENEICARGV